MRILIAEDNAQNMYLARFLLEQQGHEVIEAIDGVQAVALAQSEQPELILMDMQLPLMTGYEATREIKSSPALAKVPVIAFTALAMQGDEEKTRAAGCDGYITKPLDVATFVKQLEAWL